jgi:hypothetical protein
MVWKVLNRQTKISLTGIGGFLLSGVLQKSVDHPKQRFLLSGRQRLDPFLPPGEPKAQFSVRPGGVASPSSSSALTWSA